MQQYYNCGAPALDSRDIMTWPVCHQVIVSRCPLGAVWARTGLPIAASRASAGSQMLVQCPLLPLGYQGQLQRVLSPLGFRSSGSFEPGVQINSWVTNSEVLMIRRLEALGMVNLSGLDFGALPFFFCVTAVATKHMEFNH
jgi:hypothetical protein